MTPRQHQQKERARMDAEHHSKHSSVTHTRSEPKKHPEIPMHEKAEGYGKPEDMAEDGEYE